MKSLRANLLVPFLLAAGTFFAVGVMAQAQDVPTTPIAPPSNLGTMIPTVQGGTGNGSSQQANGADQQSAAAGTATSEDGEEPVRQSAVTPNIDHEVVSTDDIYTVHLRPLYSTVIRLPDEVTSIAVGAPTLIGAEHSQSEPRLVFIKPTTHQPVDSDVIISLKSGQTLALHVISAGDQGSADPVDFVVDYSQDRGLLLSNQGRSLMVGPSSNETDSAPAGNAGRFQQQFLNQPAGSGVPTAPVSGRRHGSGGRGDSAGAPANPQASSGSEGEITDSTPIAENDGPVIENPSMAPSTLDTMFTAQQEIAAPRYSSGADLARRYPEDKNASPELAVSLGRCVQVNDTMTVSYSVINRSSHWIEIMPPLLEFNDPSGAKKNGKVNKKHPQAMAEQVQVLDYRMTGTKLAPGQRMDGAFEFTRPDFKYQKERLLLRIADSSAIDAALLMPVPFVTPRL